MKSTLSIAYPLLQMESICRSCRGNPAVTRGQPRCGICRKSAADYKKAGLENEVKEWHYLRVLWRKCQINNQVTTGIKRIDYLITVLFGPPHANGWRDYSKTQTVIDCSPFPGARR